MKFRIVEEQDTAGNELSPEQDKFFRTSKVRNDFGELYMCFRGTRLENSRTNFAGNIKWFTINKSYASRFNSNVYAVYLNCNKIFDCGNTDGRVFNLNPTIHSFTPEFSALLKKLDITEEVFKKLFKSILNDSEAYKLRVFSIIRSPEFCNLVKRSGYDCIRTVEEQDNVCYGALYDEDIKLVTNITPSANKDINN